MVGKTLDLRLYLGFFEVPPFLYPKHVGDISKGMAEADHKILSAEVH